MKRKRIFPLIMIIVLSFSIYGNKQDKPKKNLKRAVAEYISLMAVSQTNYWLKYSNWIEDWQFKLTWEDQSKRIFNLEGVKFDSNCFKTNWTHGLSGANYYNFARTNGLNIFESSLFTTLSSLYWETIVEWREVISINDSIFTSFGGISIGESFFQLGSYFSGKSGIVNNIAGIIVNPILALNRWIDRKKEYAYYIPKKNKMRFFAGNFFKMEKGAKPYRDKKQFFGFSSTLSYIPEIKNKGAYEKFIKGTAMSKLGFRLEINDWKIEEVSAYTRNIYFGKYEHNINEFSKQYIKGASIFYGLISGFDYYKRQAIALNDACQEYLYIDDSDLVKTPTEFSDKLAVMNLIGGYSEIKYFFGKGKIEFTNYLTFDFGLINAFALGEYSAKNSIAYTKSTLYNYGYYYGMGYTVKSNIDVYYKNIRTGMGYKYQKYNSVDGADRFQEKIKDDFNIQDIKSILRFDIEYSFRVVPFGLKLVVEKKYRRGKIKAIDISDTITKTYVRLELFL